MYKSAVALTFAALLLSGCGSDEPSSNANPSPASSPDTADDLGKTFTFNSTKDGSQVGTIRFTEVTVVPDSCISDDPEPGSQTLGVRVELANTGRLALELPTDGLAQVNDPSGFTQEATTPDLSSDCKRQFPELSRPPAPGKAAGFVLVRSQVTSPSAIVYSPIVWAEDAGLSNWNMITVTPRSITVRLPKDIAAQAGPSTTAAAPAPTTTQEPEPEPTTTKPPAPVPQIASPKANQACNADSDTWAIDANGGQLRCAYAGGPSPKWVQSLPFIGTRPVGGPCELGEYVAESPSGQTMVCIGERGSATWAPGP